MPQEFAFLACIFTLTPFQQSQDFFFRHGDRQFLELRKRIPALAGDIFFFRQPDLRFKRKMAVLLPDVADVVALVRPGLAFHKMVEAV